MITKPMLAATLKTDEYHLISYPKAATPKLDGIRCIKKDGKALTRSFKPIPNDFIRTRIETSCPDGFDGEIIIEGLQLNEINSAVMSKEGEPNFKYYVFDYVLAGKLEEPYTSRTYRLEYTPIPDFVRRVLPTLIDSAEELAEYEEKIVSKGYEGVILRDPRGRYKCGRSTFKEGLLLKIKRWVDSEATIIGFEEEMENTNEQTRDALGHAERSTHKEGMKPTGMLGSFVLRGADGVEFNCGSGLTEQKSREYWAARDSLLGKLVTFKYIPHGIKEKPKNPIFKAVRDPRDL